jgi:phytoene/squalene synthetase
MAEGPMSDTEALAGFIDKWRERWPEWRIAEVFVPHDQRDVCVAWFALQQELAEAAWGGRDPLPGEAKLGWWAEELQGWSQGRRRHPLGLVLQRLPAPWLRLAASIPALIASRDSGVDREQSFDLVAPVADAMSAIDAAVFGTASGIRDSAGVLLAMQLLLLGDAAAPLQVRARAGDGAEAAARAWAGDLLQAWATTGGPRPIRLREALLGERLRRFSAGGPRLQAVPALATLRTAWRAARG